MTLQQVLFIAFGVVTLVAAVAVVSVRRLLDAARWLLLVFFGMAGLYVLLKAPFFAAVQLFVCTGIIGVLITLAITLTHGAKRQRSARANEQWWLAVVLTTLLLAVLIWLAWQYPWATAAEPVPENTAGLLGLALVDPQGFTFSFGLASVLLLVALIGATAIVGKR